MADDRWASGLIVTIESRVLKRRLGPVAWAVLEDILLDAVLQDRRWLAATSTRGVADHLGLTPGTVARALARLCADGLVHREDQRDTRTGRFGESVYVVEPMTALLPCVDHPHTAPRDTATPNTARPATVPPNTAPCSEAPPCREDERTESVPGPGRRGSSGRRRAGDPQQQLLLGDGESATTPLPLNPSATTTTKGQQPSDQTPTSQNPKTQAPKPREALTPTTQRSTDTCQLSEQALPGRASC